MIKRLGVCITTAFGSVMIVLGKQVADIDCETYDVGDLLVVLK